MRDCLNQPLAVGDRVVQIRGAPKLLGEHIISSIMPDYFGAGGCPMCGQEGMVLYEDGSSAGTSGCCIMKITPDAKVMDETTQRENEHA